MTYVSWPIGVPWCPVRNSSRGGPQDVRWSFQPEAGPAIERPRSTAAIETFDVTMSPWTVAQYQIFKAWFENDVAFGSLPFVWYHPITKEVSRWKFASGEPYSIQQAAKGYLTVTFRAVRLPGATWFADYLPAGSLLVPDLVLDFASQVYGAGGVRKTFADLVTFARAGSASYVDANGVTQSAGTDVPRFDHDPSTHAPLGLLMKSADGDSAVIGAAKWPEGLFSSAGTMLVVCRSQQTSAPSLRYVFGAVDATRGDRLDVQVVTTTTNFRAVDNSVSQAALSLGTYTAGARVAIAAAFAANDFRASKSGASIFSDVSGTMPAVDRAEIGYNETEVRIEKILCWSQALDDTTLQGLSA